MDTFNNNEQPTINSIVIPDFGYTEKNNTKDIKVWVNTSKRTSLSLNYFALKPDLPTLRNIDMLRWFYRQQIVQANGGLIKLELIEINGFKVIEMILKLPKDTPGMVYLASLTIPFENCSYVVKVEAPEFGVTGMRDSLIADRLMKEGVVTVGDKGFENWFSDPYDKNFKGGTLMNKSEEPIYDNEFKDHPLSEARKMIEEIKTKIEFKPELLKLSKFQK